MKYICDKITYIRVIDPLNKNSNVRCFEDE